MRAGRAEVVRFAGSQTRDARLLNICVKPTAVWTPVSNCFSESFQ
jgi:hypothetical protein